MKKLSLSDRMKQYYELTDKHYLTRRTPVIIRIDGKAFSTYSRRINAEKPFSNLIRDLMIAGAKNVIKHSQGTKCCYIQSDEASFLLTDYDDIDTDCWFKYETQKLASVSSSLFTSGVINFLFTVGAMKLVLKSDGFLLPNFDARCFNIPQSEVVNYFIWRQKDWYRNSVSMFARQFLSHREMNKKSIKELLYFLIENSTPWESLDDKWKNGAFIIRDEETRKWVRKNKCPIFTKDRDVIDNLVYID